MGQFKDKYKATSNLFTDKLKDKKDEISNQLKENPFEIIPIDDFVKVVNDPIGFLEEKFTDNEFIGTVITIALDCVPYVGPILSSVFSMFWPEDPKKKPISKEELDEELKKFKDEILKEIDSKIQKSEQQMWKDICESLFDTLVRRVKGIKDSIIIYKKKIKEDGEIDRATATDIRTCFTEVRFNAHQIGDFCRNEKYCHLLISTFMRVLFVQCSVMNQLSSQWYQFNINKYFISGIPAEGKTPAVPSLKEKYHDNLAEGLQYICKAVYKNIRDGKPELNKEFDENADKLFNTNTFMYPVPIVVAPLNVPSVISKLHEVDNNVPTHEISDHIGQYIYRIDAACFQYDKHYQAMCDGKIQTFKVDPLTKCKGACADHQGLSLRFKLPRKRTFKLRIFGIYTFSKDSPIKITIDDPSKVFKWDEKSYQQMYGGVNNSQQMYGGVNNSQQMYGINSEPIGSDQNGIVVTESIDFSQMDGYNIPTVTNSFPTVPPISEGKPSMENWDSENFIPSIKDHSGFTTTKKFENMETFKVLIQTNLNPKFHMDENGNTTIEDSKGFIKFVEIIFLDK